MKLRSIALALSTVLLVLLGTACGLFEGPEPAPEPIDPTRAYGCGVDGAASTIAYDEEGRPYVAGRLLVGYDDAGLASMAAGGPDRRDGPLDGLGLRTLRRLDPTTDLVRVAGDPLLAAQRLRSDARIAYAHPDYLLAPAAIPDDPAFDRQWHLEAYGATSAWDVRTSADGRVVAVVDSGFDVAHPDLAGRFLPGWDFCEGDGDVSAHYAHGTHVAGIVGAVGDNGLGVTGVAWDGIDVLPVKIFSDNGLYTATSDAVAGILWAAGIETPAPFDGRARAPSNPHPADVINLSFGGHGRGDGGRIESLDRAVCSARGAGAVVVAAAGNWTPGDPHRVMSPANGPCAFAVGSVDEEARLSTWSLYTPGTETVDVVAPGERIVSTVPRASYGSMDGTSMATPYVSGVAALVLAQDAGRTPAEVERLLRETAWRPDEDAEAPSDGSTIAERYGAGIVCIHAALDPSVFDPATGAGCGPAVAARAD